jgi:uncharacterized repeat protein (TIGR01451 family)
MQRSTNVVVAGGTVTFTVTVTNKGPADAANVTIADTFATGLNFTGTSLGSSTSSNGVVFFNLGSLVAGSNTSFTIAASPASSGSFANSVTVSSDQADLEPIDNTAQVLVQVTLLPPTLTATGTTTNGVFSFALGISGSPGIYNILATTNITTALSSWTVAGTVTNSGGSVQFTDTNTANFSQRYYRVVLLP